MKPHGSGSQAVAASRAWWVVFIVVVSRNSDASGLAFQPRRTIVADLAEPDQDQQTAPDIVRP